MDGAAVSGTGWRGAACSQLAGAESASFWLADLLRPSYGARPGAAPPPPDRLRARVVTAGGHGHLPPGSPPFRGRVDAGYGPRAGSAVLLAELDLRPVQRQGVDRGA